MRKALLILALIFGMTGLAQAQQKQSLSAAAASCTTSNTSCLIYQVDPSSGGATFTVGANASGNTLQFEATGDGGTTWVALNATPSNSTTAATSTTSTGTWQANVAAYTGVRIRMSTLVSGTSTVSIITSLASARAGGGGSWATPVQALNGPGLFLLSIAPCGALTNCWQVHDDLQAVTDPVFTASANTVSSATANFCGGGGPACTAQQISQGHTTDVGTTYVGLDSCNGNGDVQCLYNCPQGTIATVVDAHDITLSGTCARNSSATTHSNTFYWGSDDATNATAAWVAAGNYTISTGPAVLQLACGNMLLNTASFTAIPSGTVAFSLGMQGCGEGNASHVTLTPKANCPAGPLVGCLLSASYAGFALGNLSVNTTFRNINFDGYGVPDKDSSATYGAGAVGISCHVLVSLVNVNISGWNWERAIANNTYGLWSNGCNMTNPQLYAAGNPTVGASAYQYAPTNISGGNIGGSSGPAIDIIGAGSVTISGTYINQNFASCFATSPCYSIRNLTSGGIFNSYGSGISGGIWTGTGSINHINGGVLVGASEYSFDLNGGTLTLHDVAIQNHGNAVSGTIIDECGNTIVVSGFAATSGSSLIPCNTGPSIIPVPTITGTGACATVGSQLPSTYSGWSGSFACTGSTGASTVTVTFLSTAANGWNCSGTYDQTTYAVATAIANTSTACTVTFTAVATNDVIQWSAVAH